MAWDLNKNARYGVFAIRPSSSENTPQVARYVGCKDTYELADLIWLFAPELRALEEHQRVSKPPTDKKKMISRPGNYLPFFPGGKLSPVVSISSPSPRLL